VANCTANGARGVGEANIRDCFQQFGDVIAIDSKDDKVPIDLRIQGDWSCS
jgi:hypothetical protein